MDKYSDLTAPGEKSESLPERAIVEAGAELMEQTLKAVLHQLPTNQSRMAFVLMITTFMIEASDRMREIIAPTMPYEVMLSQLTGTTGVIEEIAAERKRQISNEGWTPEHDDLHSNGQLALAASCYASQASILQDALCYDQTQTPKLWPWQPKWWKPKNPRRDLIRSAALIIAEIERLDRCQKKQ